jgi:subtilisin family serine protease
MRKSILKVTASAVLANMLAISSMKALVLNDYEVKFSKRLSLQQIMSVSNGSRYIPLIIKVTNPISLENEDLLYKNGAKSIDYAGDLSYYIRCSESSIDNLLELVENFAGVALFKSEYKLENSLKKINLNDEIEINVDFLGYIDRLKFEYILKQAGIEASVLTLNGEYKNAKVKILGIYLYKLAALNEIMYISKSHKIGPIEPFSSDISTSDKYTAEDMRVDEIRGGVYNLDGLNVKIGIVDVSKIRGTHQEFKHGKVSRVVDRVSSSDLSLHSTHVGGIFGADGDDEYAKGIASSSKIYSYSFSDFSFANSLSNMYSLDNILLSNHSYGYTDMVNLGLYDSDARAQDTLISSNPYINVFMAAGNDGGANGYPLTGAIKGPANAKNIFTIGALDYSSNAVASYSSMGPVQDGRIKPDLAVRGSGIKSTSSASDTGYRYMSGTSMATPSAAGGAALVIQEYKNITNLDMRHDILKSVLINTAVDIGGDGPDIYSGYGMIDVKSAVDAVKTLKSSSSLIKEDSITNGSVKRYGFYFDGGKFKATISWVDPAGETLVNDLDIKLVSVDSGREYFPYSLGSDNKVKNSGVNSVDNIEQIEVSDLDEGSYILQVNGKRVITGRQDFAVVTNSSTFSSSGIDIKQEIGINNFARVMLDSIY